MIRPFRYLNVVHHVLPFLPGSKEFLDVQLAQCSSTLQNAFVGAFLPTMASFSTAPTPQGSVAAASRLLADYECESGKRSQAHDLVHLQCLILMIINIDNFGPVSLTGDHEGPAKATLIGRAAGLAYSMALPHEAMTIINVDDGETEQYVRVRAWWTLVILDRWNAISTATPLVISGDAVVLPHNLKPILGEANYRFTCKLIIPYTIPCSLAHCSHSIGVHHGALDACVRSSSCESDAWCCGPSLRYLSLEHGDVARSLSR